MITVVGKYLNYVIKKKKLLIIISTYDLIELIDFILFKYDKLACHIVT